jgi:hypothetical protein
VKFEVHGAIRVCNLTILQTSTERCCSPNIVFYRSKQSFALALVLWVLTRLKDLVQPLLRDPRPLGGKSFGRRVRQFLYEHLPGRHEQTRPIWLHLTLQLWQGDSTDRVIGPRSCLDFESALPPSGAKA